MICYNSCRQSGGDCHIRGLSLRCRDRNIPGGPDHTLAADVMANWVIVSVEWTSLFLRRSIKKTCGISSFKK